MDPPYIFSNSISLRLPRVKHGRFIFFNLISFNTPPKKNTKTLLPISLSISNN